MLHFHFYPTITLISKINKRVFGYIVTISFGCILYCGCFNLFCNVWVCLVIFVLIFTVFCVVCAVFFVLFLLCIFILICFVCTIVRTTATE
jgi:hypothetical protein